MFSQRLPEFMRRGIYWACCRTRNHRWFEMEVTKLGRSQTYEEYPEVLQMRTCTGCGFVYEKDVDVILATIERDLDLAEEGKLKLPKGGEEAGKSFLEHHKDAE